VSPGGKEALECTIATPAKPPLPVVCAWSWAFQGLVMVQSPPLCTVAVQCIVPSGLHEMVTLDIDGHTLQDAGVRVLVGVTTSVPVAVEVVVLVSVGVVVGVPVLAGVFVEV
jgi:hypothetical protein